MFGKFVSYLMSVAKRRLLFVLRLRAVQNPLRMAEMGEGNLEKQNLKDKRNINGELLQVNLLLCPSQWIFSESLLSLTGWTRIKNSTLKNSDCLL